MNRLTLHVWDYKMNDLSGKDMAKVYKNGRFLSKSAIKNTQMYTLGLFFHTSLPLNRGDGVPLISKPPFSVASLFMVNSGFTPMDTFVSVV